MAIKKIVSTGNAQEDAKKLAPKDEPSDADIQVREEAAAKDAKGPMTNYFSEHPFGPGETIDVIVTEDEKKPEVVSKSSEKPNATSFAPKFEK